MLAAALSLLILAACQPAERVRVVTATPRPPVTRQPPATPGAFDIPDAPQLSDLASPTPTDAPGVTPSPAPTGTFIPTETAGPTPTPAPATCADLDRLWGDWPDTIDALNSLIDQGVSCGPEPLSSKLYAAHYNFAAALEAQGDVDRAVKQYRGAFRIDPNRADALKALDRLGGLPTPTPSPCSPVDIGLAEPSTPPPVDPSQFATVSGTSLMLNGAPYQIKGVNYYPRNAPWERFLSDSDPTQMAVELNTIQAAGFNTIRIFLWEEPLFHCDTGQTIPDAALFAKIDRLLAMAAKRGLKVLVTLNDLPDLYITPLYVGSPFTDAETAYIVRRYQANPTILAWDLRNEGDLDYLPHGTVQPRFTADQVLGWLKHISRVVHRDDHNHPVTAGWYSDPTLTDPYVDFLSFHHYSTADVLQGRIADYRTRSTKPMLLEEFGYAYRGTDDATGQAELLGADAQMADSQGLIGWMVWTAFDFNPAPGVDPNYQDFYGLWTTDLTPKAALSQLPLK